MHAKSGNVDTAIDDSEFILQVSLSVMIGIQNIIVSQLVRHSVVAKYSRLQGSS